jgi:hypothetical protein
MLLGGAQAAGRAAGVAGKVGVLAKEIATEFAGEAAAVTTTLLPAGSRIAKAAYQWRRGVWNLPRFKRGHEIHQTLGENLPYGFEVIDKRADGVVTSIKTIDLEAKTYKSPAQLRSQIRHYIDLLHTYNGGSRGSVDIQPQDIKSKVLELAIPIGAASSEQKKIIEEAKLFAKSLGINVVIRRLR